MYGSMTQLPAKFSIIDQAPVDGETWYTVTCIKEVSAWLREQPEELWHEHIDFRLMHYSNKIDIHEKLYTMMALKWS